MSSSVTPRPLSYVPFIAADAVLWLTAALIAWRTPDELTGGPLLGVVLCMGLGAVLVVLPFVLNDAREREAALAVRQRELAELVTTSTANASRWGTQWAAAATGLEDAAGLASRSLAAAERLPLVFQEKADALAQTIAQTEADAQARAEQALRQESALAARVDQIGAATETFQQTLTDFARVEAGLLEQRAAIAATLAEFPAAAARAQAVRTELETRLAAAPLEMEAQVARLVTAAESRLGATTEALAERLAQVDVSIVELLVQLQRVAALPAPAPVVVAQEAVAVSAATPAHEAESAAASALVAIAECGQPSPSLAETPANETAVEPVTATVLVTAVAKESEPLVETAPVPVAVIVVASRQPVRSETIMDPFVIPDDGYAQLAAAMDLA